MFLGENDEYEAEMPHAGDVIWTISHLIAALEINSVGRDATASYIDRPDEDADKERYQTVYNAVPVR